MIMMKENLENHLRDLSSNMTQVIDTNKYIEFVRQTTSPASSDFAALLARMTELEATADADVPRLITAAFGLSAEAGEFTEVVKKILLQGKPYTEENVFHMKRELGDICWYLSQAFMALDTNFEEILQMNYEKLSARYPEGSFDIYKSENRVENDV
jgi:NTP pyrophosphatase (non-canonical NTP hydrolase)